MAHIPANVERGAAFLDEKLGPNWDERINLTTLDLASTCGCVVGQLYRDSYRDYSAFQRGIVDLGIEHAPARFGFTTWGTQRFPKLTQAWRQIIRRRRQARRQ